MFKKRAAVFYRSIKAQGVAKCFYSDKTHAAGFLIQRLQRYSTQSVSQQRFKLREENISIQEKLAMAYQYSFYREY